MALTDAQMQAMQDAKDIDTGVDTRSKEDMLEEQMSGLGSASKTAVEQLPGVGEVVIAKDIVDDVSSGDYASAGLNVAALGVGVLPAGDILNKPIRAAAKKFRRKDIEDAAPSWFKETKVSKDIKPEDAQKTQITTTTSTYEKAKNILPEGSTLDFGAGKGVGAKKVGSDTYEPFADTSFSPTYTDAKSIPDNSYDNVTSLNVLNVVNPEVRSGIVQDIGRVLKPGGTGIITTRGMDVFGNAKSPVRGILADEPRAVITSAGTYQKGFTQKELREYIKEELGDSFTVSDVSGLGKAGVKIKKKSSELNMAEGGAVPMKEQMSMFEDGGLMDEGGSIDPVSGNDVPPGSTQEEVRDDIPAQLSEGEFVFPADVVRYFGLETLMKMRQEAKAGLQRMEDMGQMGNSDEAIMSDTLPFDINDLDMEDDGMLEYADGGVVQAQQGTYVLPQTGVNTNTGVYYTPSQAQPTGYAAPKPVEAASSQYERPVQQDVPVMAGPGTPGYETPKYEDFIKPVEGATPELREYINTKTGEKMMITFINGQPTVPIPDGFVPASEYVASETTASQTSTVKSAGVESTMDEPAGREEIEKEEAMFGPGGGRVGVGGNIYGVSFSNMGGLPGVTGTAMTALGLATGKPIPAEAIVNFQRPDNGLPNGVDKFSVTGTAYNNFKAIAQKHGYNSRQAQKAMQEMRYDAKVIQAQKAAAEVEEAEERVTITGSDESYDSSASGAGLESSVRGSSSPGGTGGTVTTTSTYNGENRGTTGQGRQDYTGSTQGFDARQSENNPSGDSDNNSSSSGSYDSSQDTSSEGAYEDDDMYSKGGSVTKQMKRSGLASK